MSREKSIKKRYWAFIVYPDSAPDNWRDILQETGLPIAISPLHDKDINDGTNEPKKAHYHCIACYSGPTTFNCVKSLTDRLNAPNPIALESVRGTYRYHIHMDNPEKYQYDDKDRTTLNGFDISDFVELSKSEVHAIILKIEKIIVDENITEYSDLAEYLRDNEMITEHEIFSSHTIHFNALITSRRHKQNSFKVDTSTGELID